MRMQGYLYYELREKKNSKPDKVSLLRGKIYFRRQKNLSPIKKSPVPKILGIGDLSPQSQGSPNLKKMETSIVKIQGMLKHMDDMLISGHGRKNTELRKIAQEADSGRVNSSFQMPQNSGRESDLVTLLNIDDVNGSNLI